MIFRGSRDSDGGTLEQVVMLLQATNEEEDLRVKAPAVHVGVEVDQVRVLGDGFHDRLPAQLGRQEGYQRGLAHADVARDGDEVGWHSDICVRR